MSEKKSMRTKNPIGVLNFTQFLSAFADSVIIIIIAFMLREKFNSTDPHDPYIFVVESFFLFSYIFFAPFVGTFADRISKSKVLLTGNAIKTIGILMIIIGIDPAFCYGVIGLGAAIYGPAKYGILKELTNDNKSLLDANGKIEGFTILAIIVGTVVGGLLADISSLVGQIFCLVVYVLSLALTFLIPSQEGDKTRSYKKDTLEFFKNLKTGMTNPKMHFSYIGSGAFWMVSVVIKNALFLWVPIHLGIQGGFSMSLIVGMTAIGIVVGSLLAKKFTSIEKFYRANIYGFIVAILALIFPLVSGENMIAISITCILLFLLGTFAGMYIIPLNATLQDEGHHHFGVGNTVAIQNFVNNVLMMIGTFAVYILNDRYGFSVTGSLIVFGFLYLAFILYLTYYGKRFKEKV